MSRSRIPTLLITALLRAVLAVPWAPAAWAQDDAKPGDNAAQAFNEKDGKSVFDLAFEVREVSNGVVDQTNSAVAYASCENCQTVAIAIQIVLVSGMANVITPTNIAVAVNEQCISCKTLALAYQFILGRGEPLEFTKEGRKRLKEIQREFKKLGKSGLTVDEIRARATTLSNQIRQLLATQLVPSGDGDEGDEEQDRPPGDEAGEPGEDGAVPPPDDETTPQDPAQPQDPTVEQPPPTTEQPPPTTTEPAPQDGATPPASP